MTDPSGKSANKRATAVSMFKSGAGSARAARATTDAAGPAGAGPGDAGTGPKSRPREVTAAFYALIFSAVATMATALSLFGVNTWLREQLTKSYAKAHKNKVISAGDLASSVHNAKTAAVEQTVLAVLVVALVAFGVWRGRPWARWGTFGIWALGSFSGMFFGVFSLFLIGADTPLGYKAPAFLAAVGMLAAVLLTNMRPATTYFAANRPVRDGAPMRRGLFGPRPSAPLRTSAATRSAAATPAAGEARPERSRSKQRAETAAVAKGADLARTRAKAASKSRRRADA